MNMLLTKYKFPLFLLSMAIITSITILVIVSSIYQSNSPQRRISNFNNILNERFDKNNELLKYISGKYNKPKFDDLSAISSKLPLYTNLFVVKGDSLVFWSDNSIPFDYANQAARIIKTQNGYYQQSNINKGPYRYFLIDLIKNTYPYDNEYLISSFNPVYSLPAEYSLDKTKGIYSITDVRDEIILYITPDKTQQLKGEQEFVIFALSLVAFALFIFSAYFFLKKSGLKSSWLLFMIICFALLIRILQFTSGFPSYLADFDLFSPINYASSPWLPSLGDLFTNVLLFTILSFIVFRSFKNYIFNKVNNLGKFLTITGCLTILSFIYYLSLYLIDTLIINSSFELNLSKILDFTVYSVVAYFIIAMILLIIFYLSYTLVRISVLLTNKYLFFAIFLAFSIGLWYSFSSTGLYTPQWQELILFIIYISTLILIVGKILPFPHIATSTLLILTLTFISTFCLYHNKETKEHEERKLMALRLSTDQDKIGEYLYADLENSILNDSTLINLFLGAWYDPSGEDACINYIRNHYFNGYWSKYNAQVTLCYPEKQLSLKPSDIIVGCNEYFNNVIDNITDKTSNKTLYYVRESYGASNYIARIPIYNSKAQKEPANIIIEFTQKYVPKGLGYPELLLDKSFVTFYDMSLYSYAIYSNGELIKNVGDYSYSISEKPFLSFKSEYNFFDKNGYNHLYHIVNSKTSIVISKKNLSALDKLSPFTYQLIFHILLVFLTTTVYNLRFTSKRYPDLKSQLQIMLVASVLFASIIIGATTLHNIRSLNDKKNQDMLSEKAHSVLIEIEHKLDAMNALDPSQETYLKELLTKFSLVFFSDINLYTTRGDLLASSRPEIFEEGLRSSLMSSEAYHQIAVNQRTFFVTTEQIGKYRYLSAYIPFRNKNNELMAYINLPYFAREHELRQEISSFLVTFVNIYIILTALAVLVSLLVGNYITRPLKLIRDQFSHVKLDKRNDKITYNRRDELGNLINEYNLMLDKLADSVDKLAKSERESAWKEMARQIAHEIKNPLTPMKLSIQHLYRSWQDKAPDWESRLEKTTTSIIQQIDTLAAIASAFSDFAKFPAPLNTEVELVKLIKDTLALFAQQTELTISFKHPNTPCYVFADEKQLSRVMVNLLNNAIQSIPVDRNGKIDIEVKKTDDECQITITDNGIGIPDEQKSKIFSPNFTTKSGGAGLGLAMVKNIIDSANGSVTFKSSHNGTTFELCLPAVIKESTK